MDNKLKTTLVAAAISAVLSNAAYAATPGGEKAKLDFYDFNFEQARSAKQMARSSNGPSMGRNALAAKPQSEAFNLNDKFSGLVDKDHHDSHLGVNTFTWAKPGEQVAHIARGVMTHSSAMTTAAQQFAKHAGSKNGVTAKAMAEAEVVDIHDTGRGALIAKYQQRVNGIEVHGRRISVVMNQDKELIATTGYFSRGKIPTRPMKVQFKVSATEAINKALTDLGGKAVDFSKAGHKAGFDLFDGKSEQYDFTDQPRVKKIYYPTPTKLIPAYYVDLTMSLKGETKLGYTGHIISAEDGTILRRQDKMHSEAFTYRVFAQTEAPYTPYDSPYGNDLSPHPTGVYDDHIAEIPVDMNLVTIENSGISTNDPWLPAGATETKGNHVDAYADLTAPDGFNEGDVRAKITSANTFDYKHSHGDAYNTDENINAAVVSMFYTVNYLHDVYYDHGFDEKAGNAQADNYGRGGIGGDPLRAEGQDSSGINNADMATPPDGFSPRMQMYLWSGVKVNKAELNVGDISSINFQNAVWGSTDYAIQGEVVRLLDDGKDEMDGCEKVTNADALKGKIALVQRGNCTFTQKVRNAESAGAIGTIIANSKDSTEELPPMGGTDTDGLVNPAVGISYAQGAAIDDLIAKGNANATLAYQSQREIRDGTVDNPIIEHEWGHYVSNRLTNLGISANSQGRSMGEGWSDFFALMTTIREEDQQLPGNENWGLAYNDGGYAVNNGFVEHPYYFGLRRTPYTTDMTKNGLTFKHVENLVALPDHPISGDADVRAGGLNAEVHAAGEIWAMALMEAYVALLNRPEHTFKEAQSRMRDYMIAALKITPEAPTFTEGRDAVLAVAVANDVEDYKVMRAAFNKRGWGPKAVSPAREDAGWAGWGQPGHVGVVESFEADHTAVEFVDADVIPTYVGPDAGFCDGDLVWDAGETVAIQVTLRNTGTTTLSGLTTTVTSDADITFKNNGVITFEPSNIYNETFTAYVEATLNSARTYDRVNLNFEFGSDNKDLKLPDNLRAFTSANFNVGKDDKRVVEDFEFAETFAVDWSTNKIGAPNIGFHFPSFDEWIRIEDVGFGTGYTLMGPDNTATSDVTAMSPVVSVGASGDFSMSFMHYWDFEYSDDTAWDGGVIEVSIDGGEWTDVVAAGGSFSKDGGYTGIINDGSSAAAGGYVNPVLGGRAGFVGFSPTGWIAEESLTFPDGVLNGKDVQFRFRIGTDVSAGAWGWNIDDLSFTNTAKAPWSGILEDTKQCVNRPPYIASSKIRADEGTEATLETTVKDHEGDSVTYKWTQVSGPTVTLNDATAAKPTFTVPNLARNTTLEFMLEANDGNSSNYGVVKVDVQNIQGPVVMPKDPSTDATYDGPVNFELDFTGASVVNLKPEHITLVKQGLVVGKVSILNGRTQKPTVVLENVGIVAGDGSIALSIAEGAGLDADGNKTPAVQTKAVNIKKFYE